MVIPQSAVIIALAGALVVIGLIWLGRRHLRRCKHDWLLAGTKHGTCTIVSTSMGLKVGEADTDFCIDLWICQNCLEKKGRVWTASTGEEERPITWIENYLRAHGALFIDDHPSRDEAAEDFPDAVKEHDANVPPPSFLAGLFNNHKTDDDCPF